MRTRHDYWRAQLRRILVLLAIWAFVAFGLGIFGAEWLNQFDLAGVPLGFWVAQQGSIFVFVALIFVYAFLSDRADRAAGVQETADTTTAASGGH